MGTKEPALVEGDESAETIEDVIGQFIGSMATDGLRTEGPYSARLRKSDGSVQTTIPKVARDRFENEIDDLGPRDQYVVPEHGLLVIDLEGEFRR